MIILIILVNALAFYLGARFLRGVQIDNFVNALIVAVVVALLNFTLGTVLKIATLGILSLGIFTLILDAILIMIADYFLKGMAVKNFWWALILALVVALFNGVFQAVFM